jgi:hypothetical protein
MILQAIALFGCGTFFGGALFVSISQHPAALEAGTSVAARFFPPMYRRAAPMQIVLALAGSIAGLIVWYQSMSTIWLVGALLLISVIPITLVIIKPINDALLGQDNDPDSDATGVLLQQWGPKHWLRTIVSGAAFLVYLVAALNT